MQANFCYQKGYKTIKMSAVLFVLLCLALTGCYKKYDTDYIKKYDSFLKYSLGEYKVISKQVKEWRADPIPVSGEGIFWDVEYTNQQNETKVFSFKNYGYTDGGNDSNFGYAVLAYAIALGKEQVINDIVKNYFSKYEMGVLEYKSNVTGTSVFVIGEYEMDLGDKYYENCIHPRKGIQLKSITARQLVDNWKCSYKFEVNTGIEEETQLLELKNRTEKMMKDFFEYFNNYEMTVDLNGKDYEHSYRASYHKETDSFSWQVLADIYEAQKYKDGHLLEIDEIILNGKSISQYELAYYSFETNEYHIRDYFRLLNQLGFSLSTVKHGVYQWYVGADSYEGSQLGKKWYIKKNNKGNIFKYNAYNNKGISLSDFELISNTTAYFDKDKKSIIINSKE